MTAGDLEKLLAQRHKEDVFVPQCKDGPSADRFRIIDAWAMAKSWSKARVWGYEIKVSRADFQKDDKWQEYLTLCNELYFVCPRGLIAPEEIPDGIGLIVPNPAGTGLVIRKKAAYRTPQIPESLYRYILMSRAIITKGAFYNPSLTREEQIRSWIDSESNRFDLNLKVKAAIRATIDRVSSENAHLKAENERLEDIKQMLTEMGMEPRWASRRSVNHKIEQLAKTTATEISEELDRVIQQMQRDASFLENKRERFKQMTKGTQQ